MANKNIDLDNATTKIMENVVSGKIDIKTGTRLQKIIRQRRKYKFLERVFVFLNWSLLLLWFAVMITWILHWSGVIDIEKLHSDLLHMTMIGLIGTVPIVFIAEGIGILRSMKVDVNVNELKDLGNQRGGE